MPYQILSLCRKDEIIKIGLVIKQRHLAWRNNPRGSSSDHKHWGFFKPMPRAVLVISSLLESDKI